MTDDQRPSPTASDGAPAVLVIGAGLAGIEASLMLAGAGRKVYLIERNPYFGGNVIKSEEVFPNMECATCMIAPKQSELLEHAGVELMTMTGLVGVEGRAGNFRARLLTRARYVSLTNCIGCGACYEPCPVTVPNDFEEGLSERKAVFTACAGALPNAPSIDMQHCLRSKGDDCTACRDACMFEAIDYADADREREVNVGAIVVATGYRLSGPAGPDELPANVFSAFEFERLRASNGPTEGEIRTRDGRPPSSLALIHCVDREAKGYCSQVCCRYLAKFARYAFDRVEDIKVYEFVRELSVPGKESERFVADARQRGATCIRAQSVRLSGNGSGVTVSYRAGAEDHRLDVDMAVVARPVEPDTDTGSLAELLGVETDEFGFYRTAGRDPAATTRPGVFVAGCGTGPRDMASVVMQAEAAAAGALRVERG